MRIIYLGLRGEITSTSIAPIFFKGDTGEAGPQGLQGIQGPKGDTGEAGPQGTNAIITVFTNQAAYDAYTPAANEIVILNE